MVLWEITLATAYFLGLKRTYRLARKIQRRLISPKHKKLRQIVGGRTRAVFDVAVKFHKNIQDRDIEVGRNLGNWILRLLDRMKPSAQIRGPPTKPPGGNGNTVIKQLTNSSTQKAHGGFERFKGSVDKESNRHLFNSPKYIWHKPLPTIARMMKPANPAGTNIQYRHLSLSGLEASRLSHGRGASEGVIRKDIMQWMLQN